MQPALPTTPEAVRQWRRDTCRISQADTAAVLGISRSSIARYEAGKWPVPLWLSNAKRRKSRRRNARVPRWMRQRLRLSQVQMDILEKVLDRGQANPGEWDVINGLSDEIHSLTERLPRGVR